MNVYDKAYELARALKESGEWKEIKQVMREIEAAPETKRMLDDFRNRQAELQKRIIGGEKPSDDEMQKMEKLFEVINLNPQIRRLFEAERRLAVMMDDVNRIIASTLEELYS